MLSVGQWKGEYKEEEEILSLDNFVRCFCWHLQIIWKGSYHMLETRLWKHESCSCLLLWLDFCWKVAYKRERPSILPTSKQRPWRSWIIIVWLQMALYNNDFLSPKPIDTESFWVFHSSFYYQCFSKWYSELVLDYLIMLENNPSHSTAVITQSLYPFKPTVFHSFSLFYIFTRTSGHLYKPALTSVL